MTELTIGEVARQAGVGVETVRFYERKKLVAEPPRNESGYRLYPETAVFRIRFIKRAQELGFSLKEIEELLTLRVDPQTTCKDIRRRAEEKIAVIEGKMKSLRKMKRALSDLSGACVGSGPLGDCPIMDALDGKEPLL